MSCGVHVNYADFVCWVARNYYFDEEKKQEEERMSNLIDFEAMEANLQDSSSDSDFDGDREEEELLSDLFDEDTRPLPEKGKEKEKGVDDEQRHREEIEANQRRV